MEQELQRVQKLIAAAGICSRRKAETLIENGQVKVNGKRITIGDKARLSDTIEVNGQIIQQEKKIYYMLNKPRRYITTSDDMFDRKKVLDLLPREPRVFSVGRLDRDTTGLLLLTNDGKFANDITHPSKEIEKTYVAILEEEFNPQDVQELEEGIWIDKRLVKAKVIILEKDTLAITIHVGVHKVVKRILKELGYYVKQLHRTHIGNLAVDIDKGEYRELDKEDIKQIFSKPQITKETFLGEEE